ncbi:MAG TPA: type I-E CRISPR-associated protein Cas6/Cse3/CasE [Phycisphaerae bacterium]|nr:type I-E CRISPR-associated protein Cas6/Cse3/CasE [Phycisphaerae bacterium]
MYLSHLLIAVGSDPDRPRPGRLWIRNLYRVHQRLCMAFPSASRTYDDTDFLRPFNPDDFDSGQVHVTRGTDAGFLFRIDSLPGGRVVVLVQSAVKPDWDYAFHNAGYILAAPPESKPFDPRFERGQALRFRLLANPTRKIDTKSGPDGRRRHGKRVPAPTGQLDEWLTRRAGSAGFSIAKDSITIQPAYIYVHKTRDGDGQRLRSARYDGILKVTDPASFKESIVRGIGPGKAFGFGLLSVAPVPAEAT